MSKDKRVKKNNRNIKRKRGLVASQVLQMGIIPGVLGLSVGAGSLYVMYNKITSDIRKSVYEEVTLEYGHPIELKYFFDKVPEKARFITNIDQIDTADLASYKIAIDVAGQTCYSVLNIVDKTAPTAKAVPQLIYSDHIPDPKDCVKDVFDLSDYTVEYQKDIKDEDFSTGGKREIRLKLTDKFGNSRIVWVPFEVMDDRQGPEITGLHDMEYVIGKPVYYRDGVEVRDNFDKNPKLTIDTSKVDLNTVGVYPVVYKATDEIGNVTEKTVNLTICGSHASGVTDTPEMEDKIAEAKQSADAILKNIIKDDMTDVQKALNIFSWVHNNIRMARGTADYTSWAHSAVKAFKVRYGSCYSKWACCKALLDSAGIENIGIQRDKQHSYNGASHYWSLVKLNGEWYHCDASGWQEDYTFFIFMMTDEELARSYGNHHFISDRYPERSKNSVQRYMNVRQRIIYRNFPYKDNDKEDNKKKN
ncbi:MAG: transglutaminase domain-containing protein [Clostridiales bacterium]|nr:transglutaminase domain-containing protein [Clostridiales bacterium]